MLAVDRLQEAKAKSKIIILLSDGKSNAGVVDPVEAIEAAKAHGIKVYTIGVGSRRDGPVPHARSREPGKTVYDMVETEIDPATLAMLAKETGGHYFQAENTEGARSNLRKDRRAGKNGVGETGLYPISRAVSVFHVAGTGVDIFTGHARFDPVSIGFRKTGNRFDE